MSSTPSSAGASPLTGADASRNFSLDVLRGIALLGILMISIWDFGGFIANQQTYYRQGTHGGNYSLLTAVSVLFEGKMRALFAIAFGAGIILFLQKKDHPSAAGVPDLYIRRQVWLIVFGVFNAFILLWPGDILFHLGVMGILLFVFARLSAKSLLIAAIICTLIYCGKNYWNYADDKKTYRKYLAVTKVEEKFKQDSTARAKTDSINKVNDSLKLKGLPVVSSDTTTTKDSSVIKTDSLAAKKDTLTKKQQEEKQAWEGLAKRVKYDSSATDMENKAMRSSYGKVWNHLMGRSQNREAYWFYSIGIWDLSSMLFLGMALLGFGFFSAGFSNKKYVLIAAITLAAGFFLAWLRISSLNERIVDYAKYIDKNAVPPNQFFPIERFLLATGYASLIMLLVKTKFLNWLWQALSAVGRMAFTNYILQSIICTFFFYGYGFGFFGRLSLAELYFIVAEIWLVQIVFSVFWLRYFRTGPLEWLWRCLVYRKWLPIKREETGSLTPSTTHS